MASAASLAPPSNPRVTARPFPMPAARKGSRQARSRSLLQRENAKRGDQLILSGTRITP